MKTLYYGKRMSALLMASALFSVTAVAQDIPEKPDDAGNKVSFVKTSQDTVVYKILDKDRSKNVNENPVPHFAIHTANNKFVMTIGGQINPIIGADLGSNLYKQAGAGINFIPSQIPVPATNGKKSDFYINALNACIDFQIVGFGGTANQITGYVKLATNGISSGINLNKAYITWCGLTAGLKSSLFQDDAAIPPTIDPQGPNGLAAVTVNEFGYTSPSFSGFRFAVGLDMPTYYTSSGLYLGTDYRSYDGQVVKGMTVCDPKYYSMQAPDIPMFVEYNKAAYHVRLAGLVRPMIYRDLLAAKRRSTVGWGLSLSANLNPVEPLTIYAQATYGKGIGAFIQDLSGLPLSFTPKNDVPGEMTPTPMMGWCLGLSYNATQRLQFNVMASQARVWDVSAYAQNEAEEYGLNNYSYGYYGAANVFYDISSYFQVGLEYLYGFRKSFNQGTGHDNRIQCQVQFTL